MKLKKITLACLLFALTLVLAIHAGGNKMQQSNDGPTVFTMFSADGNPQYEGFESPVARKITEATGVKLDIEYPVGNSSQKIAVMLAAGDYPDLVFAKGDAGKFVDSGAFIDLTDLIEQYGPNIKKHYGSTFKRHSYSPEDPSIYWVGCFGVEEAILEAGAFWVQHAVVKELGYPRLRTLKDLENALKAYVAKHPTIDGKPTIPYSLSYDGWRILIDVTNQAYLATGGNGGDGEWHVDPETQSTILHHIRPIEKEYYRWLNHMYNIGLLDPECVTQKHDSYEEKISSGQVLALSDASWSINGPQNSLKTAGKLDRMYGAYPITLDERFERLDFMTGGYIPAWGVSVTTACKDPVKAIKFLDWMCTDESLVLRTWGIEGEHWEMQDGKRVETAFYTNLKDTDDYVSQKTGVGMYAYPFPERGTGARDARGLSFYKTGTIEDVKKNYTAVDLEVLRGYGLEGGTFLDLFKRDFPPKAWGDAWKTDFPEGSEGKELFQRIQEINWKRITEVTICDPAEFDAKYDAYMQELKDAGVDRMNKLYTEILQAKIKFWNE